MLLMKHSSFSIIFLYDNDFLNIFLGAFESDLPKASFLDFVGLVGWSGIQVMRHFMNCCCCLEAIIILLYFQIKIWTKIEIGIPKVKAQGLLHSLKSTQNIVSFLVAKNALELIRPIAIKLQLTLSQHRI